MAIMEPVRHPVLGTYRNPWSRLFYVDEFTATVFGLGFSKPVADSEHTDPESGRPLCFLASANITRPIQGFWWLTLNIPAEFPGTPRTLTGLEVDAMFQFGSFVSIFILGAAAMLKVDGAKFLERKLTRTKDVWSHNVITLNQDLTFASDLDVGLFQRVEVGSSWAKLHVWKYKLFGEYFTDVAPPLRNVTFRVFTTAGGFAIQGVTVNLMDGTTLVATGKTDAQGLVTLQAFQGSYVAKVFAQGYTPYPFEAQVDLTVGDASLDVPLLEGPTGLGLPWWWYIPVIGIGGLALMAVVIPALKGRRREPPIFVVR